MPKVLIADKMSNKAVEVFKARGVDVDVITGLEKDELMKIIGEYDGLAVRSSTRPDAEIIGQGKNLKVIGRAGIGVDKSLPRLLLNARNSSVISAQTKCSP